MTKQGGNIGEWGSVVPLIGGHVIGNERAIGHPPSFLHCFEAFGTNTSFARRYYDGVPGDTFKDDFSNFYLESGIDLVSLTCPCSGLSLSHNSGKETRGKANNWLLTTAHLLMTRSRPRVIIGESAPGMFSSMGDEVRASLRESARAGGYGVTFVKTSTTLHGIPQGRVRTFYIFWRDSGARFLPNVTREMPSIMEYVSQNPFKTCTRVPDSIVDLDQSSWYVFMKKTFGDAWREVLWEHANGTELFKADHDLLVSFVEDDGLPLDRFKKLGIRLKGKIDSGQGSGLFGSFPTSRVKGGPWIPTVMHKSLNCMVHPTEDRFYSLEELCHFMGIPGDFPIEDIQKNHALWNTIAQNVPTNTAEDITRGLMVALEDDRHDTGYEVAYQDLTKDRVCVGEERSPIAALPEFPIDELMRDVA